MGEVVNAGDTARARFKALSDELLEAKSEARYCRDNLSKSRSQLWDLCRRLGLSGTDELAAEVDRLKSVEARSIDKIKALDDENSYLAKEVTKCRAAWSEEYAKRTALEGKVEELTKNETGSQGLVEQLEARIEVLEGDRDALQEAREEEHRAHESDLRRDNRESEQLREEIKRLKGLLKLSNDCLVAESRRLSNAWNTVADLESEAKGLREKLQSFDFYLANANRDRLKYFNKSVDLGRRVSDLESALAVSTQSNHQYKAKCEELYSKLEDLKLSSGKLTAHIALLKSASVTDGILISNKDACISFLLSRLRIIKRDLGYPVDEVAAVADLVKRMRGSK